MVKFSLGLLWASAHCLAAVAATPSRDLFFETRLEPAQVHVQTQALYRLRFYQGMDILDLKIVAPSIPLADLRPIDQGRVFEARREGRRYRVHEQSYALFPYASGSLEIAGAHATGRVAMGAAKSSDGRRAVRIEAAPLRLIVQPAPEAVSVLAKSLRLSETWAPTHATPVGAILQRRVRIEAGGVDAGQLPELGFAVPGMEVHAGPARFANRFRGETNIGSREQTFTLVPLHSGDIVVPELAIDWWNVDAGTRHTATLPSRALAVAPAAEVAPGPPASGEGFRSFPLLAGALGLLALLIWMRRIPLCAAWRLHLACCSGNPAAVRDKLLTWAARHCSANPPLSLAGLAEHVHDPQCRQLLGEMDRSLYGPRPGKLSPRKLAVVARQVKQGMRHRATITGRRCRSDTRSGTAGTRRPAPAC